MPDHNPLLISTSGDILGIGHSSTVKGPDLDSYYIVYHALLDTLPNRTMNIDRIVFNGKKVGGGAPELLRRLQDEVLREFMEETN